MAYPDNFPKPEPPKPEFQNLANQPAVTPPGTGEPQPPKPKKSKRDIKAVVLIILIVCIGAVITKYALDFFAPKLNPASARKSTVTVGGAGSKSKPEPITLENVSTPKKEEKPFISIRKKINQTVTPFTLSGIFYSGNKNYCIINDKVLTEGDSIEGAMVTRIGTEEVELQIGDKTTKLNLRVK